MSASDDVLDEVRSAIAPPDATLAAARARRTDVLSAAQSLRGVLRVYNSGSIAHGTANGDTDADCGVVLDRRIWRDLGPDTDDDLGPGDVVEEVRNLVRKALKEEYPEVKTRLSKRAIVLKFHQALDNGADPSVDLIVALQRNDGGLWIPNLDSGTWDASDPIKHTELLTRPPRSLRVKRARVVRLGKAWNGQYGNPGMCSFNIEALALACVEEGTGLARALTDFFAHSADDVARRNTPDPAGVSKPIKLKVDRDVMVRRLQTARNLIQQALANDDDEGAVRAALADLFWNYVEAPAGVSSSSAMARALRAGNDGVRMAGGLLIGSSGARVKTTRSYGGGYP